MKREIDLTILDALKTIGKKIREIRQEKSELNYKEFADKIQKEGIDVSKNTLQRIEKGNENYNLVSLLSLLHYFDLKISDFFKEAGL